MQHSFGLKYSITIFSQISPDKYQADSKIKTRSGARTSLFVAELNQLIVAAPARSSGEAQLMIYQTFVPRDK